MFISTVLASALAQSIEPSETPPPRRYKIEAYGHAPLPCTNLENCRWNLDWRDVDMEFWSAILECRRDGKTTDRCEFADDTIEFGYVVQGEQQVKAYELPADFWLEVSANKKGRLKLLVKGDREAFWEKSSNALIGRFHKPEGRVFKPDSWRSIGGSIEDSLRYWLGGALEFQHPKEPTLTRWRAGAPAIAQTWAGGAYNGNLDLEVAGTAGHLVRLGGTGTFGEMHPTLASWATKGQCAWTGVFDTQRGILVESRTEIAFTQTAAGYNTRRLTVMREATPEDTFHAGEIPGTPLAPE